MAQITIDNKVIECNEGDYILQIARKNGIFIPAICYLSECSATLACRMCMVKADDKVVYSCNAKAKNGMNIITNSDELKSARKAIMQTYCINHPLECGVCDKSGECELQNFVHLTGVNSQEYAIKDTPKTTQDWGLVSYDPSLCIVCERCVTVCSDKIGDKALKTTARGGDAIDKSYKDSMNKDAFAVWNKFQKSLIEHIDTDCDECGECSAVCPVGALTQTHFKYSSNAWELRKIPASNPHSSDCELIYYDVKKTAISDLRPKIYRVSNDFHFGTLNKAARFGFDYQNENATKDKAKFDKIVENIQNGVIKTIKFNSFITNEEAKILSLLKAKFGLNLINDEAKKFKEFLKNFSLYSGMKFYNTTTNDIKNADFSVVAGSFLRHDAPNVGYKLNNNLKIKKGSGAYFHTMRDIVVESYSKNFLTCWHKAGIDIEILEFLLMKFGQNLPSWVKFKDNYAEILGLDEAKFDELSKDKANAVLIIGEDFITSKNAQNLAKLSGMIAKFTHFKVFIIPPRTNSLGVSLICDLSSEIKGEVLGYNEDGDYTFGVIESELIAPALNQQEGTFVSYDKRVVPTNAALPHNGYELNDIANALGIGARYTIDYTPKLGEGFQNIKFDDLENYYDNAGVSHRGYELENSDITAVCDEFSFENQNEILVDFIYLANPIGQFSKFSNASSLLTSTAKFYANDDFLGALGLKNGDMVEISNPKNNEKIALICESDKYAFSPYIPYFDEKIPSDLLFDSRYAKLDIKRVEND